VFIGCAVLANVFLCVYTDRCYFAVCYFVDCYFGHFSHGYLLLPAPDNDGLSDCYAAAAVSEEDSGNYTCELRGPQSQVLRQLTHYLFVRGSTHLLFRHVAMGDLEGRCFPICCPPPEKI